MGAGAAYKDIEFFERALEFSPSEMRERIASMIRSFKTDLVINVENTFLKWKMNEHTFQNIMGFAPSKELKWSRASSERIIEAEPWKENKYTIFARRALLDPFK